MNTTGWKLRHEVRPMDYWKGLWQEPEPHEIGWDEEQTVRLLHKNSKQFPGGGVESTLTLAIDDLDALREGKVMAVGIKCKFILLIRLAGVPG